MARIDWLAAKKDYLSDGSMSYMKIAKKYGVTNNAVGNRAKKENWVKLRQDLVGAADAEMQEEIVDELAEVNTRHVQTARNLQAYHISSLNVLNAYIRKLQERINNNQAVDPKEVYSPYQGNNLTDALKKAIELERIALGLPITVTKNETETKHTFDTSGFTLEELDDAINAKLEKRGSGTPKATGKQSKNT